MLYKYQFSLLALLFTLVIYGQGETSNWYFGNGAGITFNNDGTVTPLSNGRLDTFEGCASISDAAGNLVLYTDGIRVFDRNHNTMQNGNNLYGDPSSTQSAIIVEKPDDPNILYIFTVDTKTFQEDPDRGLNYSVVDLSLNGGNGAITQKNINLLADCSEKISAVVKDCFDKSIWVVTLGFDSDQSTSFDAYYAYEVSNLGINPTPVKSTFADLEIMDPRGYLKFSPDGSILAAAHAFSGLHLYDFDINTGIVSNPQIIEISDENTSSYGIEFSPNQQFLYVHSSGIQDPDAPQAPSSSLLQYNLTAADVSSSEQVLDKRSIFRGALQLGQNGKIYRTIAQSYLEGTPYLGVIENPNEAGNAANYVHNAVFLNNRNATQGLPPFIQSFFDRIDLVRNPDGTTSSSLSTCVGESFTLEGDNIPNATYVWEKDGVVLPNTGYTLTIGPATIADSGRYSLEITPDDPGECPTVGEAFISVNPLPSAQPLLLVQCDAAATNATDGLTTFNLDQAIFDDAYTYFFYESLVDLSSDNPIQDPVGYTNTTAFNQTIYYKIIDENGCKDFDELQLQVRSIVLTDGEKSFYACDDNPNDDNLEGFFDLDDLTASNYPNMDVRLYATLEDTSLEQNPISGMYLTQSTTIYARIEENNECEDVDILNLIVNPTPELSFESEFVWCTDGEPLTIAAPDGFDIYRWYLDTENGMPEIGNQQEIPISSLGNYILEVGFIYTNADGTFECLNETNFEVIPSNRAVFENIHVEDISDNNIIEIFVSGDGDYEYSSGWYQLPRRSPI